MMYYNNSYNQYNNPTKQVQCYQNCNEDHMSKSATNLNYNNNYNCNNFYNQYDNPTQQVQCYQNCNEDHMSKSATNLNYNNNYNCNNFYNQYNPTQQVQCYPNCNENNMSKSVTNLNYNNNYNNNYNFYNQYNILTQQVQCYPNCNENHMSKSATNLNHNNNNNINKIEYNLNKQNKSQQIQNIKDYINKKVTEENKSKASEEEKQLFAKILNNMVQKILNCEEITIYSRKEKIIKIKNEIQRLKKIFVRRVFSNQDDIRNFKEIKNEIDIWLAAKEISCSIIETLSSLKNNKNNDDDIKNYKNGINTDIDFINKEIKSIIDSKEKEQQLYYKKILRDVKLMNNLYEELNKKLKENK